MWFRYVIHTCGLPIFPQSPRNQDWGTSCVPVQLWKEASQLAVLVFLQGGCVRFFMLLQYLWKVWNYALHITLLIPQPKAYGRNSSCRINWQPVESCVCLFLMFLLIFGARKNVFSALTRFWVSKVNTRTKADNRRRTPWGSSQRAFLSVDQE